MPSPDLLPFLLFKINENPLALEAACMELTLLAEQKGSLEVGANVRGRFTRSVKMRVISISYLPGKRQEVRHSAPLLRHRVSNPRNSPATSADYPVVDTS